MACEDGAVYSGVTKWLEEVEESVVEEEEEEDTRLGTGRVGDAGSIRPPAAARACACVSA
jgi:hypothetical protein